MITAEQQASINKHWLRNAGNSAFDFTLICKPEVLKSRPALRKGYAYKKSPAALRKSAAYLNRLFRRWTRANELQYGLVALTKLKHGYNYAITGLSWLSGSPENEAVYASIVQAVHAELERLFGETFLYAESWAADRKSSFCFECRVQNLRLVRKSK